MEKEHYSKKVKLEILKKQLKGMLFSDIRILAKMFAQLTFSDLRKVAKAASILAKGVTY